MNQRMANPLAYALRSIDIFERGFEILQGFALENRQPERNRSMQVFASESGSSAFRPLQERERA
jgi:hypothetical protein